MSTFQGSAVLLKQLGGQNNCPHEGGIRPEQKPVFMFAYLCMTLCAVEDQEEGKLGFVCSEGICYSVH